MSDLITEFYTSLVKKIPKPSQDPPLLMTLHPREQSRKKYLMKKKISDTNLKNVSVIWGKYVHTYECHKDKYVQSMYFRLL